MDTQTSMYDYVMARLAEKRVPQRTVAVGSGVPFSTLTKIAQGNIKAPNVHHVQALFDYFAKVGAGDTAPETHQEAA